jgi:hypothetical protein
MARVTFWFKDDPDKYVAVTAEEFHEDGDYLKAYSKHNELVAMFDKSIIKGAYRTEEKG